MEQLIGKTFSNVYATEEHIIFQIDGKDAYSLEHIQDCCECVTVEDICGDLSDLVGTPIITSECRYQEDPDADESGTWSFFELATIKGSVTIRFYGVSNGYYSESAELIDLTKSSWH